MGDPKVITDPQQRHYEYARRADMILFCGIMSLVLSMTFFPAIAGLIMAILNLRTANKFLAETGPLFLKARIGKYLSVGGIVVGSITGFYSLMFYVSVITAVIQSLR